LAWCSSAWCSLVLHMQYKMTSHIRVPDLRKKTSSCIWGDMVHYTNFLFLTSTLLGILWVQTGNCDWLTWESDTLREDASYIIIHCLFGRSLDQKKWIIFVGKCCLRSIE
jgi:hypothetical protein